MRGQMILAAAAICLSGAAWAQDGRLSVTGEGAISVEPDIAVVYMGVIAEGDTPEEAVNGMSEALAPVLVGLVEDGIAARDIQSGSLSLRPMYAREEQQQPGREPRISGYVAQSDLSVTVRALDGLGGVLSRAVSSGSNTFNRLSWELSNPQAARDAALAAAITDAMRKAALMAQTAGVALDDIVEIREDTARVSAPSPVAMEARMMGDVPVARGEMSVGMTVSVTYSLQDQ